MIKRTVREVNNKNSLYKYVVIIELFNADGTLHRFDYKYFN